MNQKRNSEQQSVDPRDSDLPCREEAIHFHSQPCPSVRPYPSASLRRRKVAESVSGGVWMSKREGFIGKVFDDPIFAKCRSESLRDVGFLLATREIAFHNAVRELAAAGIERDA